MQNVSSAFEAEVKELVRRPVVKATIATVGGTYDLTATDIVSGSLSVTQKVFEGDFEIGGVYAADCSIELINDDGRWDDVVLAGATLIPYAGFSIFGPTWNDLTGAGVTWNDLNGLGVTWNQLQGGSDEYVRLGTFVIDAPGRPYSTVKVRASDRMVLLDRPFAGVNVIFPATLSSIAQAVATHCGVALTANSTLLPNMTYQVTSRPEDELSCRDIISQTAAIVGGYARMTRAGQLEIVSFNKDAEPDMELGPGDRMSWTQTTDAITLTGVKYMISDGTEILVGDADRALIINQIDLLQDGAQAIVESLAAALTGLSYTGYTATYPGSPAVDAGDVVKHVTRDGKTIVSLIGSHTFQHGRVSTMSADGRDETASDYRSQNAKRLASIANKVGEAEVRLTSYQIASANMNEALSLMMGAYSSTEALPDGSVIYYWHNLPVRSESDVIWQFNGQALAVSDDGGETWGGMTADSTIIAKIVHTLTLYAENVIVGEGTLSEKITAIEGGQVSLSGIANEARDMASTAINEAASLDDKYAGEIEALAKDTSYRPLERSNVTKLIHDIAADTSVLLSKLGNDPEEETAVTYAKAALSDASDDLLGFLQTASQGDGLDEQGVATLNSYYSAYMAAVLDAESIVLSVQNTKWSTLGLGQLNLGERILNYEQQLTLETNKISMYIDKGYGLELAMQLAQTELGFYVDNQRRAWIGLNGLNATHGTLTESLSIGNHKITKLGTDYTVIGWMGG